MVQDPVKENLLFAATEYGIYTSLNGGSSWQILEGSPTISFRDLTIQKRENDLVAASFGRGFFVLDDYSALREFSETNLDKKGKIISDEIFQSQKKRIYNALLNSKSEEVLNFDTVLNKIILAGYK